MRSLNTPSRPAAWGLLIVCLALVAFCSSLSAAEPTAGPVAGAPAKGPAKKLVPYIDGAWWQIAGDPDLGKLTRKEQQPVDFAIWQADDGTWQLWSCIRKTGAPGGTRLFYGWEGQRLTDRNWKPRGITMQAMPDFGERAGGLQAPHVVMHDNMYHLLYGDWDHICLATSAGGKSFTRHLLPNMTTGLFGEGSDANTRDIMVVKIGDLWYGYYTAHPGRRGAVYCRTSPDLKHWSKSKIVAVGGAAGTYSSSAECPHVVERDGYFYLFRTQEYGQDARTRVYRSRDPLNFGINQDRPFLVAELPIAAPEIIRVDGQDYVAALLPNLKGIQIAKLGWREEAADEKPAK